MSTDLKLNEYHVRIEAPSGVVEVDALALRLSGAGKHSSISVEDRGPSNTALAINRGGDATEVEIHGSFITLACSKAFIGSEHSLGEDEYITKGIFIDDKSTTIHDDLYAKGKTQVDGNLSIYGKSFFNEVSITTYSEQNRREGTQVSFENGTIMVSYPKRFNVGRVVLEGAAVLIGPQPPRPPIEYVNNAWDLLKTIQNLKEQVANLEARIKTLETNT